MWTRHLASELQYVLAIFMWMLCRNPCPCLAKSISNPKSGPRPWCFNGFDFQIALTAWYKSYRLELQKVVRAPGVLTVLASKLVSRHSVVQTLWILISSGPNMPVFNDFDFRIALSPQRGANFGDVLGSHSSAPSVFRS